MRPSVEAIAGGLAVSLPAALVAQVLDALIEDKLPLAVTVPLAMMALAGSAVGGWLVGRRGQPAGTSRLSAGALVGALVISLITGLGLLRQAVADEPVEVAVLPALTVVGALLGLGGAAVGTRLAARTRP